MILENQVSYDVSSNHPIPRLLRAVEVAEMLGVTRQRVDQIARSYPDFPEPEVVLSVGRVWSRTAIRGWIDKHPHRGPGSRLPRGGGSTSG